MTSPDPQNISGGRASHAQHCEQAGRDTQRLPRRREVVADTSGISTVQLEEDEDSHTESGDESPPGTPSPCAEDMDWNEL